jgi:hypothetical protein
MPNVAHRTTLTPDQRMDDEHAFVAMYAERQAEDATNSRADIYARNPDALGLYARGTHDVLTFLKAMFDEHVDPEVCADMIDKMHEQSEMAFATGTAH